MSGSGASERIAIVGIGGIFPGAPDLPTYWKNISLGIDAGRHVPNGRWYLSAEKAYAPWPPAPDRVYSTWGCFVEEFSFDPWGLKLDPGLLDRLDPMFLLGLHAARAAYYDAHQLSGIDHSRVGVILGNIALPTESTSAICRDILGRTFVEKLIERVARADSNLPRHSTSAVNLPDGRFLQFRSEFPRSHWHPLNRFAAGLPSSLIAQGLGFGGEAFTLDAACASSLYSLKLACEELLAFRADAMLAGGMSRPDCQYTQMGFAQLQALSRSGRCAPLSAEADGLVVGEGAGVFVLKRLSDAVASNDQIYGVIAGIGLSNDRGANLLAPHSEGQLRAMQAAYTQAAWKPSDVDLIECHATGTPVGDAVEITSLHSLWEKEAAIPGQCVIGGVKSNVGHLLTGAGAAGLMKVLLAIKHEMLPPTANFRRPAEKLAGANSPFRVLSVCEPWLRRNDSSTQAREIIPRRATVNAFGFGGINAHVLIEEWTGGHRSPNQQIPSFSLQTAKSTTANQAGEPETPRHEGTVRQSPVSVTGVDAVIGTEIQGIESLGVDLFPILEGIGRCELDWWGVDRTEWLREDRSGTSSAYDGDSNRHRPRGDGIREVRLPVGAFRIPPLEMQDMLPQQQLMLKVADGALRDAVRAGQSPKTHASDSEFANANFAKSKAGEDDDAKNRMGVFIGIELDFNTTNFHFRWSIEQDAPEWARRLGLELSPAELGAWIQELKDAACPPLTANRVMGNLGGIVASRLAREFDVGGPSFTVSCGGDSGRVAVELASRFLERGELDQAIAGAVDIGTDVRAVLHGHRAPGRWGDRLIPRDAAIALVLRREDDIASGKCRNYARVRINSQKRVVKQVTEPDTLIPRFLDSRATFEMESLLFRVLATNQGRIDDGSSSLNHGDCRFGDRLEPSAASMGSDSIKFQRDSRSVVNWFGGSRETLPVLPDIALFIVGGDSAEELLTSLDQLKNLQSSESSIHRIARHWLGSHGMPQPGQLRLAMVVHDRTELANAIQQAAEEVRGRSGSREVGSRSVFFNQARTGLRRLAFVFPGSGNAFPEMGRELLRLFPQILVQQDRENRLLFQQYRPDFIWDRDSFRQLDHKTMIFSQVAIGTAICDLLALFGIRPTASLGYSLGESAALFGLRAWTDRDEMLRRMQKSSLFGSDLVAPFDAARMAWNIPAQTFVPWTAGIIDQTSETVRSAIQKSRDVKGEQSRLYLLIINSPRQCVIGGDRGQTQWLVQELKASFVPLAAPSTVHCRILREVEAAYRELHLMPTEVPVAAAEQGPAPIDFYSTAWGRKYSLNQESAAAAIVAQANDTIDFTQVVEQAYADGIRCFIEIGPGASCTRMIEEILGTREYLALSVLPNTAKPVDAFFRFLAALIAAHVPVDLTCLYGRPSTDRLPTATSPQREVVTRLGGRPFEIPAPADGWKFRERDEYGLDSTTSGFNFANSSTGQALSPELESIELTSIQAQLAGDGRSEAVSETRDVSLSSVQPLAIGDTELTLWEQFQLMTDQRSSAHEAFLRLSSRIEQLAAERLAMLSPGTIPVDDARIPTSPALAENFLPRADSYGQSGDRLIEDSSSTAGSWKIQEKDAIPDEPPRSLDRSQCLEFAIGKIGRVLGQKFAEIDQHPTRVRLPDVPLMLVDRILSIEGEPLSMTSGRVVTEHDIHSDAWYLDCNRIPTCIAVESGQADLFLSGWLGIDFETKGLACYRLLDAVVTFHDGLPQPGKTINYDIRVLHFFRQGRTYLFRFEFDATVDGRPLLTMREGCAGFFTAEELAGGKGIIHTALDKRPRPGVRPGDWTDPVPMSAESYDDSQIMALRRGDLRACFGSAFSTLPLANPVTLPGLRRSGDIEERSRMWLIDRVLKLDPVGGKFGIGTILGELDIHPDDWFLTCHFCDDQVMPGTLMYECCLHTLRIYLLRMGWVGEEGDIVYEPIPEVRSRLKCRGQVLAGTRKVWYEVTLKEIGYGRKTSNDQGVAGDVVADAYCLADALMYADGKPIVEITDMSVRLKGLTRSKVDQFWQTGLAPRPRYDRRPALFDVDRITAFAVGNPSEAFGDRYVVFDAHRKIARLPGPPFQFLDRIVSIENCRPWELQAGGTIVAQYDIPGDAWYFSSNRQPTMPFAVLLETALQPCGWLAAYLGSALTSETDLSFRNLGGTATQFREVTPLSGTLTTTVKMTRVSNSAGMIIQHYDFDLRCDGESVYSGNTYFGFFSKAALSNQIGIRDATPYQPTPQERPRTRRLAYPQGSPFPDDQFRMIQTIEFLAQEGGPYGNGFIVGTMPVDPAAWFFKAHFYQDPVVPGSLGLESFWQLLKVFAADRWPLDSNCCFATPSLTGSALSGIPARHEWIYRGQVIPADDLVTVTAVIRDVDDAEKSLTAEGYLSVDGRIIYQMKNFKMRCRLS